MVYSRLTAVSRRRPLRAAAVVAVFLLSIAPLAWSQPPTASVAVTVVDQTGAVISGATVTIAGTDGVTKTAGTATVTTSNEGIANLANLAPGRYTLLRYTDPVFEHIFYDVMKMVSPDLILYRGYAGRFPEGRRGLSAPLMRRFAFAQMGTADLARLFEGGSVPSEDDMIGIHGKLGRSEGCFAMSRENQWKTMRKLAGGRMIYADKLA